MKFRVKENTSFNFFSKKALQRSIHTLYLKNNQLKKYRFCKLSNQHYSRSVSSNSSATIWRQHWLESSLLQWRCFIDDYGIWNVNFNYTIKKKDGSETFTNEGSNSKFESKVFNFVFDASQFQLEPGDAIHYYFEVWDNDGTNGSKSSRSQF